MKARLTFDLDDVDDANSFKDAVNASNLSGFAFEIINNMWREWKHDESGLTLETLRNKISEYVDEFNINTN